MNSPVFKAATFVLLYVFACLPCHAVISLDTTFAGSGKIIFSFPDSTTTYTSQAFRVFVQPSNRIVVGGNFTSSTPDGALTGVAFVGLTPSGGLDSGFGSGGIYADWRSDAFTNFSDALMYPDGTTLRMSQVFRLPVGSSTVRTVRLTANGAEDTVFSSNVSVGPCCFGFFQARPVQIAVRSDGKIWALIIDQGGYFLYRLNADGTRDNTFGTNGIVPISFNKLSSSNIVQIIALADGKLLIVGNDISNSSPDVDNFFLARLTETGIWDKTFGRVGFLSVPFGSGSRGRVRTALLQADGNLLLVGTITSGDIDVWMSRFRPNGRLDSTFGNNGVVIHDFAPAATDVAQSIALSPDGKIRLAGHLGTPTNFLVARFSASGAFEEHTTFGFTANEYAEAADITLQPDGKIVVVGRTKNPNPGTTGSVFAIARLTE